MIRPSLRLPMEEIRALCRRYRVRELSVFGSAVREDFQGDSDVDFLVEFEPDVRIGWHQWLEFSDALERLAGRPIDLGKKHLLKPLIRDEVLQRAEVVYAA